MLKHGIIILSVIFTISCGGGGGGGSVPTSTMSGSVIDGYITGATVCLDLNSNNVCDSGEPTTVTTANGAYSFSYPSSTTLTKLNVIVKVPAGAIDSDNPNTPIAAPYQLSAPATNSNAVTPLTSLVVAAIKADPTLTPASAATQITTALNLPNSVNLFQNYLTTSSAPIQNVAKVVNVVLQNSAISNAATITTASLNNTLNTAQNFVTQAYSATTSDALSSILNTATVASANGALISTVPAASYSNQDILNIYNDLSTIRSNAGVGLLAENSKLNTAASNHALYLTSNNLLANGSYLHTSQANGQLGGHFEQSSLLNFTGGSPQDRANSAGYSGTVTEVASFGVASGQACISSLENSVYHLTNLLSPYLELGIGYSTDTNGLGVCTILLGLPSGNTGQYAAAGSYGIYPYDGQISVAPKFYNQAEYPTPVSDLANAGHPIFISLYNQSNNSINSNQVNLHSFTLQDDSGTNISLKILVANGVISDGTTVTQDSNISSAGYLVAVPISPLKANTNYRVNFSATLNQSLVSKSWKFTTGASN
jgi:uncharacterized protein YkwD